MGIHEVKRKRFEYLYKLWEVTGGDVDSTEDVWEIGSSIKLDMKETQKIVSYLMGESFVDLGESGGTVKLTSRGAKEVEKSIKNHEEETNPKASLEETEGAETDAAGPKGNSSPEKNTPFMREVNLVAIESYFVGLVFGVGAIFVAMKGISAPSIYMLAFGFLLGAVSITCFLKPENYENLIDRIFGSSEKEESNPASGESVAVE